jgi:hypothetical protein
MALFSYEPLYLVYSGELFFDLQLELFSANVAFGQAA